MLLDVFATGKVVWVQWQDVDLMSTTSCLGPWTTCSIPVPKEAGLAADDFQLDFVVKGPKGDIDKPQEADTYHVDSPGGYKLRRGDIRPFPQASLAPFMLVCSHVLASCLKSTGRTCSRHATAGPIREAAGRCDLQRMHLCRCLMLTVP